MIYEVFQAVKDKPWTLTAANHRSFNEVVWNFPGAGAYLGADGERRIQRFGRDRRRSGSTEKSRFCVSIGGDGDF